MIPSAYDFKTLHPENEGISQHPTYKYDLQGRRELVITSPHLASASLGGLRLSMAGQYLVRTEAHADVLLETSVGAAARTAYLGPGRLFVQRRTSEHLYEGTVEVTAGRVRDIRNAELRAVAFDKMARKGAADGAVYALATWFGVATPPLDGFAAAPALRAAFGIDLPSASFGVALTYIERAIERPHVETRLRGGDLTVEVRKVVDVGPFAASIGLRGSLLLLRETYETERKTSPRWSASPAFGPIARLDLTLGPRLFVGIEGAARSVFVRVQTDDLGASELQTPVVVEAMAGVGLRFQ